MSIAAFAEIHEFGFCDERFGREPLIEELALGVTIPN
jgi:hypothetical protein